MDSHTRYYISPRTHPSISIRPYHTDTLSNISMYPKKVSSRHKCDPASSAENTNNDGGYPTDFFFESNTSKQLPRPLVYLKRYTT